MTGRERMLKTLSFEEPDRPPHFETMFELEREAFGLSFPDRHAWRNCTQTRKRTMVAQCMDIAAVKRSCYGKLALMGNVQCSLLQDGPASAIRESARYCLEQAAPGGGYIFGTSNTLFSGMPLKHYEYMLAVFREWQA